LLPLLLLLLLVLLVLLPLLLLSMLLLLLLLAEEHQLARDQVQIESRRRLLATAAPSSRASDNAAIAPPVD
jgi:hypothetical protein